MGWKKVAEPTDLAFLMRPCSDGVTLESVYSYNTVRINERNFLIPKKSDLLNLYRSFIGSKKLKYSCVARAHVK